eukprot:1403907-Alexandrium_andersonii.AAC.1
MSASLVGSEMCIRDRQHNNTTTQQRDDATTQQHGNAITTQQRNNPAPQPVSYTHLTLPTICSV